MKIGFVGLGSMGMAMARRLLEAGHELTAWNRTAARLEELVADGARGAGSPAEAAREADLVFSMLFDDAAVEEATFGERGIARTLAREAIHVCTSTLSLAQARRLRDEHQARGQAYLSATVLGRPPAAAAGELHLVVGGDEFLRARVMPVLKTFGPKVFIAGDDPVQANLIKLSLNFLIMSTLEQMAEVFTLSEKAGTDPSTLFEIMTGSFFSAPVHRNYGRLMLERAYDKPGAPVALALKDTEMFLAAGHEHQVPLPYASIARDRFLAAMAQGHADKDFIMLLEGVRHDAGLD